LAVEHKLRINKKFVPNITLMIDTDIFSSAYFFMWLCFTYSALALSGLIIHNASTEQGCIAVMLWSCVLEVPAWILVELLAVLGEVLFSVSFIIQLHFSSCVLNGMTRW